MSEFSKVAEYNKDNPHKKIAWISLCKQKEENVIYKIKPFK